MTDDAANTLYNEFDALMASIYKRTKDECKYNASYFIQMLGELGGVETARKLLNSPKVSDGFVHLYSLGRLDLTVEAQLLANPQFWSLFSEDQLSTARRWLREHNYKAT